MNRTGIDGFWLIAMQQSVLLDPNIGSNIKLETFNVVQGNETVTKIVTKLKESSFIFSLQFLKQ